jgi:2-polyprenyl-6-hydroxyphenyl methylase/3-demethylubiquinone-9 3-methyltransferase
MTPTSDHASEISRGQRFKFGANWTQFPKLLDDECIAQAEESLKDNLNESCRSLLDDDLLVSDFFVVPKHKD